MHIWIYSAVLLNTFNDIKSAGDLSANNESALNA